MKSALNWANIKRGDPGGAANTTGIRQPVCEVDMVQSKTGRADNMRRPEESIPWEGCTVATGYGDFCNSAVPDGSPLSICGQHLIEAYRFCEDALDIAATDDTLGVARSDQYVRFLAWQNLRGKESGESIVYYALIGDVVKIGTTTNLRARMCSLKADLLLATEPGSWQLEDLRHKQFEHLRAPIARHRELFMQGDELISHIEMLRHDQQMAEQVAA